MGAEHLTQGESDALVTRQGGHRGGQNLSWSPKGITLGFNFSLPASQPGFMFVFVFHCDVSKCGLLFISFKIYLACLCELMFPLVLENALSISLPFHPFSILSVFVEF